MQKTAIGRNCRGQADELLETGISGEEEWERNQSD
jgi:hypothetical protein